MPRNGSGTYSLVNNTWYPPVTGVLATQTDWTPFISDVAAALTQSISSDGQTPFTGNLPMGNNKITGSAKGSALTDLATIGQLGTYSGYVGLNTNTTLTTAQEGYYVAITAGSLTITLPAGSALRPGHTYTFSSSVKFTIARGSTDTIDGPQATGATSVVLAGICSIVWIGTNWKVLMGGDKALTANPGYQYFPSGLIMQWGSTVGTTDVGGNLNITFPQTFPTNCFAFLPSNGDVTINSGNLNFQVVAASVNTVVAPIHATTGSTGASFVTTAVRVNWVAFGN